VAEALGALRRHGGLDVLEDAGRKETGGGGGEKREAGRMPSSTGRNRKGKRQRNGSDWLKTMTA
jgi:hypothetical protein